MSKIILFQDKPYRILDKFVDGGLVISKDKTQLTNLNGVLGRENWIPIEPITGMLTNEEIADALLSDMQAYTDNIREIIIGRMQDSTSQKVYWDAWFRGAKGEDLEKADAGQVYNLEAKRQIEHFFVNEDVQIQIDHKNPNWFDVHGKLLIEYVDEHLQDNDFIEDETGIWRDTTDDKLYNLTSDDIAQLKRAGFCRMYLISD